MNLFIGRKIKQLRIQAKLSLKELSLGIMSFSLLSMIENGKSVINEDCFRLILSRLNRTMEDFTPYLATGEDDSMAKELLNVFIQEDDIYGHLERLPDLFPMLDKSNISHCMRIKYIYIKSLYCLNAHRLDLLEDCYDEMQVFELSEEECDELTLYFYWSFMAKYFLINRKTSEASKWVAKLDPKKIADLSEEAIVFTLFSSIARYYGLTNQKELEFETNEIIIEQAKKKKRDSYLVEAYIHNFTVLYNCKKVTEESLHRLEEGLSLAQSSNDISQTGRCLHNIGLYYSFVKKNYELAISYWKESLLYKRRSYYKAIIFTSLLELINYYIEEDLDQCEAYILEGIQVAKEIDNEKHLHIFNLYYAELVFQKQTSEDVSTILEKCERYFLNNNQDDLLQKTYQLSAKYYAIRGKRKKSMQYILKTNIQSPLVWRQ